MTRKRRAAYWDKEKGLFSLIPCPRETCGSSNIDLDSKEWYGTCLDCGMVNEYVPTPAEYRVFMNPRDPEDKIREEDDPNWELPPDPWEEKRKSLLLD